MKLIITNTKTEARDEFNDVTHISYEDQYYCKNGRWLHVEKKDGSVFGIEIDKDDEIYIYEK